MSVSATIQPDTHARSALNARLVRIAAVAGIPVERSSPSRPRWRMPA